MNRNDIAQGRAKSEGTVAFIRWVGIHAFALLMLPAFCWGQPPSGGAKRLNRSDEKIDYYGAETTNAFDTLARRVEKGEVTLDFHPEQGYLPAILKELQIPVESQLLLFSKSSMQARYISPETPRALYFNDEVTLGWIPEAPIIELMAQDPVKGTMFYSIPQTADAFQPRRDQRCNGCHTTSRSAYLPGYLLRSAETDHRGGLISARAKVTHETPVEFRWGGWYITGETAQQSHRGNLRGEKEFTRHRDEPLFRGALPELSTLVDLSIYPVATSDVAAALVMDHFADTYNLLVRVGTEHRLGEPASMTDELVAALLTLNEAPLHGPIRSGGGYTEKYLAQGPHDAQGRSLRELDLQSRVFRWGVSPMVYTTTFQQLPAPVKSEIQSRMTALLEGTAPWPESCVRSVEDRQVALSILRETIPDWPAAR